MCSAEQAKVVNSYDISDPAYEFSMEDFKHLLDPDTFSLSGLDGQMPCKRNREQDIDRFDLASSSISSKRTRNISATGQNLEDEAQELMGFCVADDHFATTFLLDNLGNLEEQQTPPIDESINLDSLFPGFQETLPLPPFGRHFSVTPNPCVSRLNQLHFKEQWELESRDNQNSNQTPRYNCKNWEDPRIPKPIRFWTSADINGPVTPMKPKFQAKFPGISPRRVYVDDERSLSTAQKKKHKAWSKKRQRCLTGHKGYKCPAKSKAARMKVRCNGRFDLWLPCSPSSSPESSL